MSTPTQKPYRSNQSYATPADFLAAVRARLGIAAFTFDFAADAADAVAENHFDVFRNALSVPHWEAYCSPGWGWLNPPYTRIGPWAQRCLETGAAGGQVALLVPAATGANWFRDYVDGYAAVLLLNGRLAFMPDKPTWYYPKDCVLALYGPHVTPGYEVWDWRTYLTLAA